MSIEFIKHVYFRMPRIVRLLLSVLFIMVLFGIVIHYVEPKAFPSIFEGVWWAFVTGATVGYGDYVPYTVQGKLIGILLILSGGGLLTFYITHISASTIEHEQDLSKGKVTFKGKDHFIFIGWNERSRRLIDMAVNQAAKTDIVIIDRTLNHLPYKQFPVHFIHGDASEDQTLKQANIDAAKSIVVTADHTKNERQADYFTILTTVAIRGNNKDIPIITEILTKSQIENASRAGASSIIRSNDFMSTLIYHDLVTPGKSMPLETILYLLKYQHFSQSKLPAELEGKSFQDGSIFCVEQQQILLGVIRQDKWKINPPANFILEKEDKLLTLTSRQ